MLSCINCRMSGLSEAPEMQTPALGARFPVVGPRGKVTGRKRGRPPTRKMDFQDLYVASLSALKMPKKRGRKPGFKLKPRMETSPLASSPPSSTPEPELGSLPRDAAIVPHSAKPQVLTETSVPDDFLCEPSLDPVRYKSALAAMASQYNLNHAYGGGMTPMGLCRPAYSPERFQEGNRNVHSATAEAGEPTHPAVKDPSSWGVDEVVWFIKDADPQALGPHAETFRKHEIDGDALLLLKSEMMMKYLGLKLGPALKLCYHIDRLKQNRV
ncbi:sex comb on midleg-like protein 4 isoform X3 [Dunckerocampus dactyliophorus]|uniref:sex comb on midleg-like protein 4 isoform X3 n=1 Tax=Dunckerocampus dactyliophorus TaxID=161453 RepID=UPI002405AE83|nr:sex comb on midleg-like protein 4 isoform X3 [Dunckerocampus dactyliophorus]